ncbi:hypothetical protein HPB48_021309 [Haemaphysalis longicornis]|uniref:DUF7041 domain-containing protein n=1 Tax=Haemaphysalis longicornis TaxID=44386 RepID=A0A9J6FQ15_HAELO|nr:hypothetical protein HPB48_021309 [Haemaphysalis longicornis]
MTDPRNVTPSGPLLPDASSRPPDVAVIQLRLPTFVEAVCDLHRVTSETTRFRHLLCNLPPEVADEVADVIGAPLNDAPYQRLKQSLMQGLDPPPHRHAEFTTRLLPQSLRSLRQQSHRPASDVHCSPMWLLPTS